MFELQKVRITRNSNYRVSKDGGFLLGDSQGTWRFCSKQKFELQPFELKRFFVRRFFKGPEVLF